MAEGNKHWYVLRAISGKEGKIKELLEATCKNDDFLNDHLHQILVPT